MDGAVSYSLAPRQRRLVRLAGGGPGGPVPVLWLAIRLRPVSPDPGAPTVDRPALARAVAVTAERHEILRTRLADAPGLTLPLQTVEPGTSIALETDGLPAGNPDDPETVRRAAEEAAHRTGDGPAAILLRPAGGGDGGAHGTEGGLLVLTAPATLNDPAGMLRWADEIALGYAAELGVGAAEALPPVELQLAQIGEWQTELLDDPDEEEARRFWRERPTGVLADLPVPLAAAGPECPARGAIGDTCRWLRRRLRLRPEALEQALETLGASSESILLTAWRATLARCTGDPTARLGVWAAGRQLDVLAESLGPVGRFVPLGNAAEEDPACAGDRSFAEAVRATAAALDRATEAQEQFVPGDLPEGGDGAPGPDRFAVAFRHVALGPGREAAGLAFTPVALGGGLEPVGVELSVEEGPEGLSATLGFDPRILDTGAADRLLSAFDTLAPTALAAPRTHVGALPVLDPETERAEAAAGAGAPLPAPGSATAGTVPARLVARAADRPRTPAILDGDDAVTFEALEERSRRLAARLAGHGVRPEIPVGLVGHRDAATLVGLVAILRAGGTLLPLDPAHPEGRIAAVLEQARPAAVLSSDLAGAEPPPAARAAAGAGIPWLPIADEEAATDAEAASELPEIDPEHSAYLLFTSGSTGRPKGTRVSHGNLAHLLDSLETGVLGPLEEALGTPIERVAINAPLVFDASVKQWAQLAHGRTVVPVPEAVRLDARRLLAVLDALRVDLVDATPTHLEVLFGAGLGTAERPAAVLVGGEAVPPGLWHRMGEDGAPRHVNVYGPTECTVDTTAAVVAGPLPDLGAPLPGARIHVLDELARPVPRGAPGGLYIGGPGVARGYHGRPAATAERFVPDPFADEPGSRLFDSGDLGRRLDDGTLLFLGRRDRQVKLRGLRLELGEIEAVLASHPAVRQAVVDTDGERLLGWAAVGDAADDGPARLREELREHLRHRLPEFMVPGHLGLLAELPRTRRGKVDREALAARGAQRDADRGPRLAPRNDAERRLVEIWSRVLDVDEVGVDENFFDLGGHSLLMVRLYDELQQSFDTDLPMLELFRRPTVAALAAKLEGADEEPAVVQADRIRERARRQNAAAAAAHRRRRTRQTEDPR